jgi:DNA polymerase elongation subunit (family B)
MKKEFSEDIKQFLKDKFPDADIYSMNLEELKRFKEEVTQKRQEYNLLELSQKVLANAAYGSCASNKFYFYNLNLAGDITGECRELTKTMWKNLEEFFHETIWTCKDLWEQFDFALDESKHDWFRQQVVSCYSDTDSVYTTYETFFNCFTEEYQKKYDTVEKQIEWILKFNQEFLDKQNTKWCEEIYNPRHGKNVHEFELETVSQSQIILKKKKYLKGLRFNKGKFLDKPKMSGTGIEIIKSTTPKLCREILTDLTKSLMFDFDEKHRDEYIMFFNDKLREYRKIFYKAPIEDISQSVGIGAYKKYVIEDEEQLLLGKQCPVSVQAIARYNHLAYKNGQSDKRQYSGKIKYYNIIVGGSYKKPNVGYFGYPAGELPEWAPQMDKQIQWQKNVIDPINRFLEVMKIPLANASNVIQLELF